MLGVGCLVLDVGCWMLGVGCYVVGLGVGVGVGCCDLKTCNDIAGRRPMTTKKGAGGEMGTDIGASKALWQSGSGVGLLSRWALLAWVRSLKV